MQSMRHGHMQGDNDSLLRHKVMRIAKSKRSMLLWTVIAGMYMAMVNTNLNYKTRVLMEHQEMADATGDEMRDLITENLGDGECDIGNPTEDSDPAPDDATRTLLTSYPGSGKRFTWTVIKALTNSEVADDWNFSEKLHKKPLTIKTSWPHKEGTWSWYVLMNTINTYTYYGFETALKQCVRI